MFGGQAVGDQYAGATLPPTSRPSQRSNFHFPPRGAARNTGGLSWRSCRCRVPGKGIRAVARELGLPVASVHKLARLGEL